METNKRKTLVILSPGFPENEADSTCLPPQQIFVKALKEVYPELNIIVLTFQYPFFSAKYDWHGVRVISFGGKNKGRLYRLFMNVRILATLRKLRREEQIIGLLSFWFGKCAYLGNLFTKKYHLKHYSWILGQDAKAGNKYFRKINPEGESLIALSDFIVREFSKNYGIVPAHIVPVGINTSLFKQINERRNIDILGAGSLIPLKQYRIFITMISALKEFHPEIKAAICGDGPEREELQALIELMKLDDNVVLLGRLTHQEVLTYMQKSRIFLHPSDYEGFGAVCLEALYAGADVVSFVKPMDTAITNWHIAADKYEMLQLLKQLLAQPIISRQPVLPYTIQDNAKKMIGLFDYNEPAIS
ncbi:glycosyltransferase [Pedobacter sp. L105]|uniref:glycosyltransferase n=1 Tax=Pedobacter sp. L105 TaxID=1641871 RepID=UPI00131E10B7|nr:glycosyltransferase [Pedobacter sp. L105]